MSQKFGCTYLLASLAMLRHLLVNYERPNPTTTLPEPSTLPVPSVLLTVL